ncbi:hypothetical protein E1B28_009401 [Marasmius oreades]|uniref:Uncharacterized protein n=1 Tax=Marasmius oreades TaxID=181124 RepID=A0A9P7S0E6_9AGAR|nr:uncharacterized protein E1B28_009401 [Marasmius oreades]KAG7093116.1 hypothetical protein E1B28_009401 [Marasmius oreades]
MAPLVTTKDGLSTLYQVIGLVCQTFVYGIYAILVLLSTHYMVKKSLRSPIRRYLFIMSLFMFLVCTLYWIFKILRLGYYFYGFYMTSPPTPPAILDPINHIAVVLAAVCTINYFLSDCTVLWRAWVLCRMDIKYLLYIPLFFLFACACTCTATIVIRITIECMRVGDGPEPPHLTHALDIVQVGNLLFSLVVNILSTLIVALKAWRHRRWIKHDLALDHRKTKAEKVLVILVESGLLYSICGVIALASTLIRLPIGTLGDMYSPVNFQIAGMYPILVLLLVSRGNSLEETSAFQGVTIGGTPHRSPPRSSQLEIETMQFRVQTIQTDSYDSRTTEDTL